MDLVANIPFPKNSVFLISHSGFIFYLNTLEIFVLNLNESKRFLLYSNSLNFNLYFIDKYKIFKKSVIEVNCPQSKRNRILVIIILILCFRLYASYFNTFKRFRARKNE